jgi:hypothetical protein
MTYVNNGKQVLFVGPKASVHIADAVDSERAHFLATMANAPKGDDGGPLLAFDYATEAEKTCSIVWNPHYVDHRDFNRTLSLVIQQAENMNLFKKLFFRGKTPDEVGFEMPSEQRSLGPLLAGCTPDEINIIHGIVGVITEAGEMAELLMAFLTGTQFDRVNALEEAGDVEWYQHRILRGIGATAEMRDRANIDKLHGRHGNAFDVFRDANRDLDAERGKLEVAAAPLFERDRETSDEMSSLAAKTLADPNATDRERSLAGSVLSQDETPGRRIEDRAGASDLASIPPRQRNDPPLPAGAASAPNVGTVEHHARTPVGDCEGMDC